MTSSDRKGTLKYDWLPQVFLLQFSLIAGTFSLRIDNNELIFAIQKSWEKSLLKTKTCFSPESITISLFLLYLV